MLKLKQSRTAKQIDRDLHMELGEGPLRFGPVHVERPLRELLLENPQGVAGLNVFASLSVHWNRCSNCRKKSYTDAQIFRILRFTKFDERRALGLMKRADPRRFHLNAFDQQAQLKTKTLFPVPNLRTLEESPCFYMRPSRYDPRKTPTNVIIDNLIYVMETYASRDVEHEKGIAFIANMNNWTFDNFSTDYCFKFMQVLQGRSFPAKVNLFLIVNPPSWFDKIWNIMKSMLSTKFQRKVHMIPEDELPFFFKQGFEKYLPDEFIEGKADTAEIVDDFIQYRQALERATGKGPKRQILFQLFNRRATTVPKDVHGLSEKMRAETTFCQEESDTTEVTDEHSASSPPSRVEAQLQ
ncbi:CRAL/TRIO domain containing protein [Nitzschia inconspicua]|uniref:CRAL/TRIO domain containing protein n=1 Tax=Nitzschia inconspicua TaxID=303405 RepID=A0A9K3PH86_9STRA|nr:CRAL/TRIO domain containing protein [Nitzschia inconspicua]